MVMHPALWWAVVALVFFILEISTASFFFLWIGMGALVTVVVAFVQVPVWVEYTVFAVSSVLLVAISRRWAGKLSGKSTQVANVDALIGKKGQVTKVYPQTPWQGYAKFSGEIWRVENKGEVPLRLEEEIRVVALRSNVLWVEPAEDGTPEIKNESKL